MSAFPFLVASVQCLRDYFTRILFPRFDRICHALVQSKVRTTKMGDEFRQETIGFLSVQSSQERPRHFRSPNERCTRRLPSVYPSIQATVTKPIYV
jgi:hypothetical protein